MSKSIEDRIAAATGKLSSMMREMAAENGDMTEEEMFAAMTANKRTKKTVVKKVVDERHIKAPVKEAPAVSTVTSAPVMKEERKRRIEKGENVTQPDVFSAAAREMRRFDQDRYEARLREMGRAPPTSEELEAKSETRSMVGAAYREAMGKQ